MSYQIQVFHPATGAYVPTQHTSDDLRALRRLCATSPFPNRVRIVDESGTAIPNDTPTHRRSRPLTLQDIARIMGVPTFPNTPPDA